jgi:putative Mg2+ transporter-C (MgtC) family protein
MDLNSFFTSLYTSEIGLTVVLARLVLAARLGAVLGFDREMLARPAGLRTHMLVSLAAATFTVITFGLIEKAKAEGASSVDPIRVIEAVTAGVAFLAAGTIIFSRGEVHGLTTGASLWLSGAIGVACGIGYYFIAVLATVLAFFVLTVLRWVEKAMPQKEEPPEAEKSAAEAKD